MSICKCCRWNGTDNCLHDAMSLSLRENWALDHGCPGFDDIPKEYEAGSTGGIKRSEHL